MTVEDIVAEDERDAIVAHELAPEDERMGKADRFLLDDVVELNAPGSSRRRAAADRTADARALK